MGERAETAAPGLIKEHLVALCHLAFGPDFYDRTAQMDLKLVETGAPELANELALIEERMVEVADEIGESVTKADGVGRIFRRDEKLLGEFAGLLGRLLPVLGHPSPADLVGKVSVAVDLQMPDESGEVAHVPFKGRLDAEIN